MVFYPLKKYFPAIAEMKAKMKADMSEEAAPAETEE
jgi:hypothetical protein